MFVVTVYNFVIDNELLNRVFTTHTDYIGHIAVAAPNILAIITFQINKKIKNRKLSSKIDILSKKFGLTYILLILLIVIINVSTVPENTINSLSGQHEIKTRLVNLVSTCLKNIL